ncbi:MAG: hypothetical protein ACREON_12935, partial [Gemmatimonadaceae bacterium]
MSPDSRPDDEGLWLLLERYLAGGASAAEAESVRDWLAADPQHAEVLDDLARIRRVGAVRPPERTVDEAWARAVDALGLRGGAPAEREAVDPKPSIPAAAASAEDLRAQHARGPARRPAMGRSNVPPPGLTWHRRMGLPSARVVLAAAGVLIAVVG